jgi:hypothetical protein
MEGFQVSDKGVFYSMHFSLEMFYQPAYVIRIANSHVSVLKNYSLFLF